VARKTKIKKISTLSIVIIRGICLALFGIASAFRGSGITKTPIYEPQANQIEDVSPIIVNA
jgi:hypothetical protein